MRELRLRATCQGVIRDYPSRARGLVGEWKSLRCEHFENVDEMRRR